MARSAESLHRAAVDDVNRGRLTSARRRLDAAARLADDPDLTARVRGTLALVTARLGAPTDGETMCLAALALPGVSSATAALLSGQLGTILHEAGRLDDAHRWLTRAIDRIDDPVARANLLVNRSVVAMERRRLDDAAADTAEAAAAYAAAGREVDEAEAMHNLGYIDLLRGDLVAALEEMAAGRSVLIAASPAAEAVIDVDRAAALREAGLTRAAESALEGAARSFGALRMPRERAQAELDVARSALPRDPARAEAIATVSARRFRRLGNRSGAARADAVRLRAAYARLLISAPASSRNAPPPPAEVSRVLSELLREGLRDEAAALDLTRRLWEAARDDGGDVRPAERVRVPRGASLEVRLLAHEVRAARAAGAGDGARARRHAARGLDVLAEWRRTFGSLDLQTATAVHGTGLLRVGLTAALASGRAEAVFDWSERARHHSIQVVPLRPSSDAALADDLAELRMLRADADPMLQSPRAAELQAAARQRQWARTSAAPREERVTLDELRAALGPDTAALCYVRTDRRLAALVVTDTAVHLVHLPEADRVADELAGLRADLDMAATVRAGPLADVVRRACDARVAQLSRVLLAEPARLAGDRRLVLTTPGALAGIPWAMLPAMTGRPFTLAGSASRWVRRRPASGGRPDDAAGAADERSRTAGFAVGPRVARGREEVDLAAAAWTGARVLAEATVDAVAALAEEVDLLHVAAHGRHAVDNPLFSGLELSDGALFGYDVDRISRPPETVVLSACEAGRSAVRWGEEAVGMTRVWLHAGSLTVIAAPVVVADDDACELLGAMHRSLAAGIPPAEGLAAASVSTGVRAPFQAHGVGF